MTMCFDVEFSIDDSDDVTHTVQAEGEITPYRPATYHSPAEGGDVTDISCVRIDGVEVTTWSAEIERAIEDAAARQAGVPL